jgi:hypothetical protein
MRLSFGAKKALTQKKFWTISVDGFIHSLKRSPMSFPYTPAQIAAFRSAFETIVEAIEQGEKAKADEQFISLMHGLEEGELAAKKAQSSQVESHHSKDVFSFFPWFGKKKKIDKSSIVNVKRVEIFPEPVKANHAVNEIPALFHFESSDTRVANRFFADLPWVDDKSEQVVYTGQSIAEDSQHTDISKEKIENESQDNRVVSSFFSDLPWATNDSIASSQTGISTESLVEKLDVAKETEESVAIKTPNRIATTAKLFFSQVPWSNENGKSVELLSTAETTLSSEVEFRAEKTITISLKDSKPEIIKNTDPKKTEIAKAFFLRLPWENSKNNANGLSNTVSSNDDIVLNVGDDESLIKTKDVIGITKELYDNSINSTTNSFFSQLPWLKAGLSAEAEMDSDLMADKFQPPQEKLTSNEKTLNDYFQSLPWQDGKYDSHAPENFRRSEQNESEATGIFALAAQSAIRASQKISVGESNKNSQITESFFSALPWNGS